MTLLILIIILTISVLLEGFFSGSEMAVVSSDKAKLTAAAEAGSQAAKKANTLVENPARFFSITLLGNNICTVTSSAVLTLYIIDNYGEEYTPFALLLYPITLTLGELVPKSLYQYYADRLVLHISPWLIGFSTLLYPVVWPLSKFTNLLLRRIRSKVKEDATISREELELMIEEGGETGTDVKPIERNLLSRIFDLAEKKVENIMTPLVDVIALENTALRQDAIALMEEQGFSRIPIYREHIYNMEGILWGTDVLFDEAEMLPVKLMRKPYYVPEEMPLDELLVSMKRRGQPMAIVVDEYGAATGIVTVEDLLEEVVGEIQDEHDEVLTRYQRIGPRRYLISGRMEIEAINERLKLSLPEGDYETMAGFVVHLAERIPKVGEVICYQHLNMTIRRASDRAVEEVEVAARILKS